MPQEIDPNQKEPQPKEMKHYLELLKDHGIDFDPSDWPHLEAMDEDELTEYFYQALLEAGIEEPERFMVEHALVEGFQQHTQEELEARKSRELRGKGYRVDDLDEQDRQAEAGNT